MAANGWMPLASEAVVDDAPEDAAEPSSGPRPVLVRKASVRTTEAERTAVKRCLAAVEAQAQKRLGEGLSPWTFFMGVVNSHMIALVFAAIPQHFWIIYMLETLTLFPVRFARMHHSKPLGTTRYMLDFCWISNFLGNATLLALLIDDFVASEVFSEEARRVAFCAFWSVANGPLLLATGMLGNALVFHDVDNTVSLFIHLLPALQMYAMRWHREALLATWPHLFRLDYYDTISWQTLYGLGLACYVCWWVLYAVWITGCGLLLPQSGNDTVFHWALRGPAGPVVAKVLGRTLDEQVARAKANDFSLADVFVYMGLHALAVCLALGVALPCFYMQWLHGGLIAAMALVAVYNGAARYSHFLLRSYGDIIRRELGIDG